ncbi:MAG: dehydrogenase [Planctomycetaceae bacterium]|nr:dehydrogenase [Planctomycetaceae bacterium]
MKLRVGVVGLGNAWETRHRLALLSLSDRFEVRAVCCDVAQRAELVAREFGASAVDGYQAMAACPEIDAVLMLAPGWYGALPILAACDSGKAVYCAAALDLASDRIRDIKQRIEEAGIAFMAELPRRHMPATLRLKELIATRLGEPQLLFCHLRQRASEKYEQSPFNQTVTPETRDLIELVDWCRYVIGGEPASVLGVLHATDGHGTNDYAMMSLDFSSPDAPGTGALAQISCGEYMPVRWQEAISFRPPSALQVVCANGVAFIDLPSTLIWFDDAGRHMESLESERPVGEQLLSQFHRAVTSLVRKSGDLEDAYRAVQITLEAKRSFQEGRRLAVDL